MNDTVTNRLQHTLKAIASAEIIAGRSPGCVRLLAVSKKQSIDKIRMAFDVGQTAFGESYLQEALEKQHALHDLNIEWHFIGNIQSNKAKKIAQHFDWVQSVNKLSIAEKLSTNRPDHLPPLNLCIEVNIDEESSKSGITANEVFALAKEISNLPNLKLRGLMVIPKKSIDEKQQRITFQKVATLYQTLIDAGFALDTLSMGMSSDLETAIAAGSTMVRVGMGIFGER